jgi:hypothetical protein
MKSTLGTLTTFAASVVFGCAAAIAIASTAAVSEAAPSLRQAAPTAPVEVIRLEPVTVTISKTRFEEIRAEGTALARSNGDKKVTRG